MGIEAHQRRAQRLVAAVMQYGRGVHQLRPKMCVLLACLGGVRADRFWSLSLEVCYADWLIAHSTRRAGPPATFNCWRSQRVLVT